MGATDTVGRSEETTFTEENAPETKSKSNILPF